MTVPQDDSTLVTHWRRQNLWSTAANKAKNRIGKARGRALLLTTTAAVLSTTSTQLSHWNATTARTLAILAAIELAVVPFVSGRATPAAVRDWTRLRSVSEALKVEVYTYLAGVKPYRGQARRQRLQERVEEIAGGQPDLQPLIAGLDAADRPLPGIHDVASYIRIRLNGQIDGYYRPRASDYRKKVDRLRTVEICLTAFAAVLAVLAGFYPHAGLSAWVAVVTTIGAAVAAHAAAQRYEYQQIEFARTADQLETLRTSYEIGPHDDEAEDRFVEECERVISIQNEGWMAKLVRSDATG
jgi:hypothetical protein